MKVLLFIYCFGYRKVSSQVRMLWEDHRNDLFINGFGEYACQWREWLHRGTHDCGDVQACSCPREGAN